MDEWSQSPKRSYSRYGDERDDKDGRADIDDGEGEDDRDRSRHKRKRSSEPDLVPQDIEFRILCPVSKIGSVIGKGGSIIKALRQESRAKIKVEDVMHGADERIIYVSSGLGLDRESRDSADREHDDMLCPAQDALFRIFSRITERVDSGNTSQDEDGEPPTHVTVRLLVSDGQVGCLIGKGGRIIEQMRKDIAAQIRVLPKASLPPCAYPNDELVQLSGTPALVREALYAVSNKLYENPVREKPHRPSGQGLGASFSSGNLHSSLHTPGSMYGLGQYARTAPIPVRSSRSDGPLEEEFMVCVLCPNEKIGSVIGKGGSIIRKLREDSGAKIRVCDRVGDVDERVIQISAIEFIDSYASPTLEAVMQVFRRLAEISAEKDGKHAIFSIRMLVRANQIGCLLGKGGQIITEMRKSSRANIRIPSKDELPSCADDNSELVQVSGEPALVEAALIQILTRLRTNLFNSHGGVHGSSGIPPPSHHHGSSYGARHEPRSPGGYPYNHGTYNSSPRRDSRRRQR